jgi:hypothetical protein
MPFSRGITRGYATQRTEDLTGPGLESHAVEGDDALLCFTLPGARRRGFVNLAKVRINPSKSWILC